MNAQLAPLAAAPFDVLAVVSSAGGLDAMSAVLADLPASFPVAVVVGQHLGVESALVEILARRITLPVEWACEGGELQPGRVYVVPPRTRLEVLPDRTCTLSQLTGDLLVEKPLDVLLRSLADSCGARALAVVLTGMGSDGAMGARAVRAAGGAVVVQSPSSAAFPDMPRAAAEAGAADLVLPLAEIGRAVLDVTAGGRFPHPRNEQEAREALFAGAGEARAALRAVEWSSTPPGNVLDWPQSFKAIVATMLHSRFPTCIFWGAEFVQVYNDAWIAVLGSSHPGAAGVPARSTWSEIWAGQVAGYRSVLQTGQASYFEDQLFEVRRHGFPEEAYFTVSHSPVHDDQGAVQGVMTIATETTERVLAARRQGALRALAATGGADTVGTACDKAADVLAEIPRDVPFALVYACDRAGLRATLQAAVGLRGGSALAPHGIDLAIAVAPWPVAKVLRQGSSLVLNDLAARLRGFHAGPWPEAPSSALLLPLGSGGGEAGGVLVAGLSPRLPLDAAGRDFFELLARQLGSNIAAAVLREGERQRIAQLAELDRTRTEFFSNVSHEFRTPLTLILAPLEDLLEAGGAEVRPLRRDLEIASRNARRLLNLVDTLLDFSQIEADRLRANFRAVDLAAYTEDIAGLFRSAAERAGLAFEIACEPLAVPVRADPAMWEKIVSNLLSNALKFTFEGGIAVRLRDLGQHVELVVSDTGVGIPPDEVALVFQRFHRVRGTRARTEEGAGIGLSLVHELVQLHHGRIRVRSEPGRGSVFTVWIPQGHESLRPLEPAGAEAARHRTARQLAGEAERWSGSTVTAAGTPSDVVESVLGPAHPALPAHVAGARLLVVDDNADMREYLARTLGGPWQVTVAADGEEALRLARADPPDLVLADVMMPGLDGFALLRELRADDALKATPLVLVTARAHEDAAIEGLLAGADDYIAKPFSSRELVARIGAQLELARVRRQGERQVRELLALMPVGVYACDTAGNFEYFNRTAAELWGREPQRDDHWWAFCGAPRALLPDGEWLQPDDSAMAQVLRTGQPVHGRELAILRADGARLELLLNIRPLREDGRVVGAVSAFLDVTARKHAERALKTLNEELEERMAERTAALRESEAKYSAAFDSMDEGFCIMELVRDARGDIVDLVFRETNQAFTRNTGLADVTGRTVRELLPAHEPYWIEAYTRVARTGEPERVENYLRDVDRWYNVFFTRVGGGGSRHVAVLFADITGRKRADAVLRESEARQTYLLKISDTLRPIGDALQAQAAAMRVLGEHLGIARAQYYEVDAGGEFVDARGGYAQSGRPQAGRTRLDAFGPGPREAYLAGRTFVVEDTAAPAIAPEQRHIYEASDTRSAVGTPLTKDGRLVAVLALSHHTPRAWSPADVAIVEDTAERVWAAAQRAQVEAALRERVAWQRGQREALEAALEGAPLAESLGVLVATAVEALGEGTRAAFYLADGQGLGLHPMVGLPGDPAQAASGLAIGPESLACDRSWSFPIKAARGKLVGS
ncbi:MAG TPA: chemotaxis protein CheB, partial [Ramlibacter sp.]|uniref:chemotaxis protein CheB n=1 Tax=Ramlibacter sp. TaxID=1917967 RepID=UPI002ED48AE7